MFLEAIYHSPYSEYCHAINENTIVIRLRTKKSDVKNCIFHYCDRFCKNDPPIVYELDMQVTASDLLFDYFECELTTDLKRIRYYFSLHDESNQLFFCEDTFFSADDFLAMGYGYEFHYLRKEDIADVPAWAKESVIYQIFPLSFASSKNYIVDMDMNKVTRHGRFDTNIQTGTLKGITDSIPYLVDLGINCIYLTPIFTSSSYHKYDTRDYLSIDPCFGDNQSLKELVAACHQNGIRVILDGVLNHCGSDFFAFRDVLEKWEASRYKDWFFIKDFPLQGGHTPNYECFAYISKMPKLNTGNEEVKKYLIDVAIYWIKEANIDGWRLDIADEVDLSFWREFRKAVKSVNPDIFLIAETWHNAHVWLQGDQFDSTMNYLFRKACVEFFAKGIISAEGFAARINYLRMRYKKNMQLAQMNLLDSHDVPRFLSECDGDIRKLKLAALFQMTHIGIPSIYYGCEKGMSGVSSSENRSPMVWKDNEFTCDIFQYYKKLISIRKQYMPLMLGSYITEFIDPDRNLYIYSRQNSSSKLIIAINNNGISQQVDIQVDTYNESVEELLENRFYKVVNSKVTLVLPAFSGTVLLIR
ncbi:MAG: glycoside hydrolase family 13 protein [Clostridia bacterium]|nr:glycoside hydrolase family 13 protein [Clostridia bacterium]